MSDLIPITVVIAEKVCDRLDRALCILESVHESELEHDLIEVASAIFEAQQTLLRLARSRQEMWSISTSSECD